MTYQRVLSCFLLCHYVFSVNVQILTNVNDGHLACHVHVDARLQHVWTCSSWPYIHPHWNWSERYALRNFLPGFTVDISHMRRSNEFQFEETKKFNSMTAREIRRAPSAWSIKFKIDSISKSPHKNIPWTYQRNSHEHETMGHFNCIMMYCFEWKLWKKN